MTARALTANTLPPRMTLVAVRGASALADSAKIRFLQSSNGRSTVFHLFPAGLHFPPDAPCIKNPELWFSTDRRALKRAAEACEGCSALKECREYGEDMDWGVWGGVIRDKATEKKKIPPRKLEDAKVDKACLVCGVGLVASSFWRGLSPEDQERADFSVHAGHSLCGDCYRSESKAGRVPGPRTKKPPDPTPIGACLECGVVLVLENYWRSLTKEEKQESNFKPHRGLGMCSSCHGVKTYHQRKGSKNG